MRLIILSFSLLFLSGCTLALSFDQKKAMAASDDVNASSTLALRRLLESEDAQVRALAARELGDMGTSATDAVPSLHRLVDDPDRQVRVRTAVAIAQITPEDHVAIPALVRVVNDPESTPSERDQALELLQLMGPRGQAALLTPPLQVGATTQQTTVPLKAANRPDGTTTYLSTTRPTTRPADRELITPRSANPPLD